MTQPTRKTRSRKAADRPPKPYPDFPLYAHLLGYWSKKILGTIHHFGRWGRRVDGKVIRVADDGWKEALERYKVQADDRHAGRAPRARGDALTVADLCNRFLTAEQRQLDAGEISARMFAEYRATTDRLVGTFGKARRVDDLAPEDFGALRAGLARQFGPVRLGNEVQKVRTVFKYAVDNGLTEKVVRYGSEFAKPSKRVLRRHRATAGRKTFSADELRRLLDAAGVPLRAMVLLGVNCGFGNNDCGTLPLSVVDFDRGWVEFPRPKTGISRRCPLWPETAAALREAVAARPTPKDESAAGLVFVTKHGNAWAAGGVVTAVSQESGKLLRRLGISRPGVGFYALRHTLRTVADATRDPNAIRLVTGHTDDAIDDPYTHGIDNARLRVVADHVRRWLFGADIGTGEGGV